MNKHVQISLLLQAESLIKIFYNLTLGNFFCFYFFFCFYSFFLFLLFFCFYFLFLVLSFIVLFFQMNLKTLVSAHKPLVHFIHIYFPFQGNLPSPSNFSNSGEICYTVSFFVVLVPNRCLYFSPRLYVFQYLRMIMFHLLFVLCVFFFFSTVLSHSFFFSVFHACMPSLIEGI